jgi:hypothetical protein
MQFHCSSPHSKCQWTDSLRLPAASIVVVYGLSPGRESRSESNSARIHSHSLATAATALALSLAGLRLGVTDNSTLSNFGRPRLASGSLSHWQVTIRDRDIRLPRVTVSGRIDEPRR